MSPSDAVPHPPGTWRFGRIAGTDLLARPSLLVMGIVLVVLFAPRFDGQTRTDPYVVAAIFVVALYVSVFLHEIAHMIAARSFGMRVPSVTLHLLGGETAIQGESRSPWQELVTAIVGPIVSLVIGLLAGRVAAAADPGVLHDVAWSIGWVNVVVAAFNMLPGLPLDGGRVMKALIWWVSGRETLATRVAAWIGRGAAVAVAVAAVLLIDFGRGAWAFDVAIFTILTWFLWTGAGQALTQSRYADRLGRLEVRSLVEPGVAPEGAPRLPVHLGGAVLVRAMAARPATTYAVVDRDGDVVGVLHATRVDEAWKSSA